MKRWMFVIVVGIILLCYGIATIMNMQDLSVLKLIMIVFVSIVGFMMVVIGIIYSQKRVLEMLVEDTDERMEKKKEKEDVNVNSLIFDKKVYKEGPKIVVIGGGTGLNTVLKGLKDYTNNLTAIASMTDYGDGQTETNSFMPLEDVSRAIVDRKSVV